VFRRAGVFAGGCDLDALAAVATAGTPVDPLELELSAAITAELDNALLTARLAGAAAAIRQQSGLPITPLEAAMLEEHLAPARDTVPPEEWDAELSAGRALNQEEMVTLLRCTASSPT
jgi:hypothetical protein